MSAEKQRECRCGFHEQMPNGQLSGVACTAASQDLSWMTSREDEVTQMFRSGEISSCSTYRLRRAVRSILRQRRRCFNCSGFRHTIASVAIKQLLLELSIGLAAARHEWGSHLSM